MREFTTAAKIAAEEQESVEFKIDGQEIKSYRPGDGQIALVMAGTGRHTSVATRIASIIDFMMGCMDEDSATYITERLMDRTDPFGLEEVEEILGYIIEEWTGRPTPQRSASTSSQQTAGQVSTALTPASI